MALTQESFHKYNGGYDCPGKCSPELGMLLTMTDVSTTCAVVPRGGVLPYMTNTGMCRLTGYGSRPFLHRVYNFAQTCPETLYVLFRTK